MSQLAEVCFHFAADFTNTFRSLSNVQAEDNSDSLPGPMQQVVFALQSAAVSAFRLCNPVHHACGCMQ